MKDTVMKFAQNHQGKIVTSMLVVTVVGIAVGVYMIGTAIDLEETLENLTDEAADLEVL